MFDDLVVVRDIQLVGINRSLGGRKINTKIQFACLGGPPKIQWAYLKRPTKLVFPDCLHHCVLQIHQLVCGAARPVEKILILSNIGPEYPCNSATINSKDSTLICTVSIVQLPCCRRIGRWVDHPIDRLERSLVNRGWGPRPPPLVPLSLTTHLQKLSAI